MIPTPDDAGPPAMIATERPTRIGLTGSFDGPITVSPELTPTPPPISNQPRRVRMSPGVLRRFLPEGTGRYDAAVHLVKRLGWTPRAACDFVASSPIVPEPEAPARPVPPTFALGTDPGPNGGLGRGIWAWLVSYMGGDRERSLLWVAGGPVIPSREPARTPPPMPALGLKPPPPPRNRRERRALASIERRKARRAARWEARVTRYNQRLAAGHLA